MKKLDLVEAAAKVWKADSTVEDILSATTISALKHYTEEMNSKLYILRGMYDNPLATKKFLDEIIRENTNQLKSYGVHKPLQLVMEELV